MTTVTIDSANLKLDENGNLVMQIPMSAAKSSNSPTYKVSSSVDISSLDIDNFRQQVLKLDKARQMVDFLHSLGDVNHLRVLSLLAKRDLCVCDLANILEMTESVVSEELETLRALKLVSYSKRGDKVYYRLLNRHVLDLYKSAIEHLEETNL